MSTLPQDLAAVLQSVMQVDRYRLQTLAARIERARREGQSDQRLLEQFQQRAERSSELRERRGRRLPAVQCDPDLPITARQDEIVAAIDRHPVVVICGETGSGKSTQLPKMCLSMGRGIRGMIGHTQPRRIAARSVAARLADELGSPLGEAVGFKIRFTDTTGPHTYVKLMTDGMLLAETPHDRFLDQYDTLIIDEAHERSLNIDFLLGYVRRLLPKRPDLRVIITSATIDAERFSSHFESALGPAPVIQVSGRSYPVDVWYRPPGAADDDDEPDRQRAVLNALDEILGHDAHGDVLVFLATEREILELTKALRGREIQAGRRCEVLPLYARLSAREQNRVFEPHTQRRIILATNVAESSLTVPGIRYVIDEGTARISRYAARSKIQRLPIEPISQASADQRKGRCGRLGPGICVRLYTEEDYAARDRFTAPEIRRSNLAAVILQAEALRLGNIDEFPFLDPPQPHLIRDGYATLFELGAVDEQHQLTPLGRQLSRLPTDPRIGRILLAGISEGCLREILIIASALEVQDPRERPADKQQAADAAHARFADAESDFLSYLRIWDFYHDLKEKLSRNQLKKACHQNFLSPTRMHEWLEVYRQLKQLTEEYLPDDRHATGKDRIKASDAAVPPPVPAESSDRQLRRERELMYGRIHRALLTGLLSNIAVRTDVNEYTGAGNMKLHLWPGSVAFATKPKWIVAAELLETSRRFARCVASIRPEWIEPLASHLLHRSYSDPYWNRKSGSVMAYEKTTLFGLTITPRRPAPYGAVDPEHARRMFIQHGLVEGDLDATADFLEHNRRLRTETEALATRSRRPDLFVDDYVVYGFYHRQLPADVYDWSRLNRWRRDVERERRQPLHMTLGDISSAAEPPPRDEFPETLDIDRLRLPLEYRFEPGAESDGVTVVVPQAGLGQLTRERLEWLVPGLVEQKVEALIRSLPKNLRRGLIPVAETTRRVAEQLQFGQGDFLATVARQLSTIAGDRITPEMFDRDKLPVHCRMIVRVVDESGQQLHASRELQVLHEEVGEPAAVSEQVFSSHAWHRDQVTRWDFGPLLDTVVVRHGGVSLTAYPAIVDQGNDAALRLLNSPEEAARQTRAGIRRLFVLAEHRSLKAHVAWLPELPQISILAAPLMTTAELHADIATLLADRAFLGDRPVPRSAEEFQEYLRSGREEVTGAVQDVARLLGPLFKNFHAVRLARENCPVKNGPSIDDLREQLAELLPKGFLIETPWMWLQHFPRYLEGMRIRLQKLGQGGQQKDRQISADLVTRLQAYRRKLAEQSSAYEPPPELATYRWMLEEYRVSLFAQQLGTAIPVSAKRLDKQWERVS